MEKPLVSVLMACYNHEAYVVQSINSVLAQTYPNIELIVIDDFSTDRSREVITELAQKHSFKFITNERNEGLNTCIIKAINLSSGPYICFLASDDYMHEKKTEMEINFLLQSNCDAVYATGYSVLNNEENLIPIHKVFKQKDKTKILEFLYTQDWGGPLMQSSLLKTHVMKELIPLRQQYKSDDWAFIIKAYEQYNIAYLDEPVFYYRLHENNTHKNYWFTYPMRIDIASRLVPPQFRKKTLANINLSQGNYLIADRELFFAFSFYVNSLLLNFNFTTLLSIMRSVAVYFRDYFKKKN